MNTSNNKILIIGGSAGIGFETAKLLSANNKVIITGRNEKRLKEAVSKLGNVAGTGSTLGNVTGIVSDIASGPDTDKLVDLLYSEHSDLNVVINNAGAAYAYRLNEDGAGAFEKASEEILTNYLAIVRLNEKLLPLLRSQKEAAIVNVSSIVTIVPGPRIPTYSASKAALHSYTVSLRHALAGSSIKVFELLPPLVNTDFSAGIGGHKGIAPSAVADELLAGLQENRYEIHVGQTADLYKLYLSSPEQAIGVAMASREE
jgi:uncharacterized oxidoreductase